MLATDQYSVKVIVTGMYLSPEFRMTYKEIENDGIEIDENKIEIKKKFCDISYDME